MKLVTLLTLVFLTAVVATTQAAVFERDWKTPGEGLLTYDDVNQREWLDLSETLLVNWGSNPANVVAELGSGGYFEGFTFAKSADLIALAESAGIDTGTLEFVTNGAATSSLVTLLEGTSTSGNSSFALIDEFSGTPMTLASQQVASITVNVNFNIAGLRFIPYLSLGDRPFLITGVMLYRVVPEPLSSSLVISISLLYGSRRSRLRKRAVQ